MAGSHFNENTPRASVGYAREEEIILCRQSGAEPSGSCDISHCAVCLFHIVSNNVSRICFKIKTGIVLCSSIAVCCTKTVLNKVGERRE